MTPIFWSTLSGVTISYLRVTPSSCSMSLVILLSSAGAWLAEVIQTEISVGSAGVSVPVGSASSPAGTSASGADAEVVGSVGSGVLSALEQPTSPTVTAIARATADILFREVCTEISPLRTVPVDFDRNPYTVGRELVSAPSSLMGSS